MRFCFNDLSCIPPFIRFFFCHLKFFMRDSDNSYRWHCIIFIGPDSRNFSTILLVFYGRVFNGRKNNINKLIQAPSPYHSFSIIQHPAIILSVNCQLTTVNFYPCRGPFCLDHQPLGYLPARNPCPIWYQICLSAYLEEKNLLKEKNQVADKEIN